MFIFSLKFGSGEHSSTKQFVGNSSTSRLYRLSPKRQGCDRVAYYGSGRRLAAVLFGSVPEIVFVCTVSVLKPTLSRLQLYKRSAVL